MSEKQQRRRRADGEESRRRILDAAAEIAGERGYEGTSISLVSARCGLPASSIYWHFKNKDDLLGAVIERSFGSWLDALDFSALDDLEPLEQGTTLALQVAKSLLDTPDFLRLGLMLTLERRPVEASARRMFLQVRDVAMQRLRVFLRDVLPDLPATEVELLATYAMAGADGLFVAHEIGGDSVDLLALFRLHAETVGHAALRLVEARR